MDILREEQRKVTVTERHGDSAVSTAEELQVFFRIVLVCIQRVIEGGVNHRFRTADNILQVDVISVCFPFAFGFGFIAVDIADNTAAKLDFSGFERQDIGVTQKGFNRRDTGQNLTVGGQVFDLIVNHERTSPLLLFVVIIS